MSVMPNIIPLAVWALNLVGFSLLWPSFSGAQTIAETPATDRSDVYSFSANTRRVVVDVVATDFEDRPRRGLSEKDFSVEEDGISQRILSFDSHEKDAWTGTRVASLPQNTFIELPSQQEQGPLYFLLYDMLKTASGGAADVVTQVFTRQQMVKKFVESMPQGARFAVLVISDGLHLIQGFTTERPKLLAALDPQGKTRTWPGSASRSAT